MKESPKENWHFPLKEIAVLFKKKSTEKIEILTIMEQYINKEIIATEIEGLKRSVFTKFDEGVNATAQVLLDFLNTLKAKEVDLEKEARHYLLHEHKSPLSTIMHQTELRTEMQYHEDIENAFKAGFELGLKAQKGGEE